MNWKKNSIIPIILLLLPGIACRSGVATEEIVPVSAPGALSLDPRVSTDPAAERFRQLVFNGLTRLDENRQVLPDLAERFEGAPDFKAFVFRLRKGVRFHNDRSMSSLDVRYTFETLLAADFISEKKAELIRLIAGIETPDPLTAIFHCHLPCPKLPAAIHSIGIIPEGTTTQQSRRPIGTGPYRFTSQVGDEEIRLAPHPGYFGDPPEKRGSRPPLRLRLVRPGLIPAGKP